VTNHAATYTYRKLQQPSRLKQLARFAVFLPSYVYMHVLTYAHTGGGQNNGNTKHLRNRICVGYIERTTVGNTECPRVCLHSVVLVSVHW
jgi:hypothetical protein